MSAWRIIVDSSVALSWYLSDESSPPRDRILEDIVTGIAHLIVPDLWWYEMVNGIKSAVKRERISIEEANRIIFFLKGIEKEIIISDFQGQPSILNHAVTTGLTAYDAAYFHLAITSGAFLITADREILKQRESHDNIISPEDYVGMF